MSLFGTPNIDDMKAHWVEVEKNKNNLDEIEKIYFRLLSVLFLTAF